MNKPNEVRTNSAAEGAARGSAAPRQRPRPQPRYQLLIECASEAEQETLYRRLQQDGLRCRPLVTA